ncbi:MAG: TIGR01212 family radical SAM protein [Clostridia bacterium]|nr:TIGR01212 family radical SAM protein [Clostridia bacterium]
MEKERYNHLNKYLKEKFGERTLKICIDANFTCPNRDGKVGTGGCIFCSEKGSGEHLKPSECLTHSSKSISLEPSKSFNCSKNIKLITSSIQTQIRNHLNSYRGERANNFIAYFQNYTNTYDSLENLKARYDAALIDDRIACLAIATRPDCIDEDICKLIASYKNKVDVWVELGLQTANDETGKYINRGYSSKEFTEAVKLLNKYDIESVAHIIVGLPGETIEDIKNTVTFINSHNIQGLKIHSCYVIDNTVLGEMYKSGNYTPITLEYYLETASYVLTHINPQIIIHKVSGDAPKDLLLAPEWNLHKKWIMNGLDKLLKEKNLYQGMYYKK